MDRPSAEDARGPATLAGVHEHVLPRGTEYRRRERRHGRCRLNCNGARARADGGMEGAGARGTGLWRPVPAGCRTRRGPGPLGYAPLAEAMGATNSKIFNVSATARGHRQHGSAAPLRREAQKARWLTPLLAGGIRSVFCMTGRRPPQKRCHQHTRDDPAGRRRTGARRPQVGGHRHWPSAFATSRCSWVIRPGLRSRMRAARHATVPMVAGVRIQTHAGGAWRSTTPHGHVAKWCSTACACPRNNCL